MLTSLLYSYCRTQTHTAIPKYTQCMMKNYKQFIGEYKTNQHSLFD